MIRDAFDRATLAYIRKHLLVIAGASEREAFISHAREIELIDRLAAAAAVVPATQALEQLLKAACDVRDRRININPQVSSVDRAACDKLAEAVEMYI